MAGSSSGRGTRPAANVFRGLSGMPSGGSGASNHSRPTTPSIGTAASRPPADSTMAAPPPLIRFGARASTERASATARTVPRRFATPSSGAGAPGTAPMVSSVMISRASLTSTASVRPPIATTHARRRCAPGRTTSADGVASFAAAASGNGAGPGTTTSSAGKPAYHAQELVRRERLGKVLVGALLLTPNAIALLVLRRDEHDRRRLRARVAAPRAQDLVPVALGHDDVEQHHVGMLGLHLILELLAVAERHDIVPGTAKNRLHQLQVRVRVVDHHHLRHFESSLLARAACVVRSATLLPQDDRDARCLQSER